MSAPPRALSNPPFLAPARGLGSRDYSCILPGFPVDCHLWRIRHNIPCGLSSAERQAINSRVSDPAIILDSLEKWFPPAPSGWRGFLQPFAPAETISPGNPG